MFSGSPSEQGDQEPTLLRTVTVPFEHRNIANRNERWHVSRYKQLLVILNWQAGKFSI